MSDDPFVLVAGGGPVGATLALDLARRNVPSVLVDDRTEVAHRPKAQLTNARSMEHFRRLGVADRIREAAPLPPDWPMDVVFTETLLGREIHRFESPSPARLRGDPMFSEPAQRVPQYVVEEVLRDELGRSPSAEVRLGWRLDDFEQGPSGVRAAIEADDGRREVVTPQWLVGCDGATSTVRARLGIDLEGTRGVRLQMGVFFRSPQLSHLHGKGPAIFYFVLNREVTGLIGPVDDAGSWWFQVSGFPPETAPDSVDVEGLLLAAVGGNFDFEVTEIVPWRINVVLARSYGRGRVWMAGDAVHQHPPTGGFGMNTGIGEAVDLAWKLAAVHDGWGGDQLVPSYEAERRPVARRVIDEAVANALGLAETFAPAADGRSPDGAEIAAKTAKEFQTLGIQLGYRYARSPIVVDDGTPEPPWDTSGYEPTAWPGCRLPHKWLAPGDSLYDHLGPGFTLVTVGADAPDAVPELGEVASAIGLPFDVVPVADEGFAATCGARFVLVRPDQHVAWRGNELPPDPGAILDIARGAAPVLE